MFVVVDYCKGNLRSVQKALELAGCEARISAEPAAIRSAQAIVLPGVGSFADASATMLASGQMDAIRDRVAQGAPFLGICLGLQLLFERGDENMPEGQWAEGLALLRGSTRRIDAQTPGGARVKVPHVGWNQVAFKGETRGEDRAPLFAGIPDGSNFYFTHSYQGVPSEECDVLAEVTHATAFPSVVRKGAVFGVQFHPEKSSHKGLEVLENFVRFVRGL
ncbi:MAG: imidazole glycerol phosphate synthase subunit HisH [Coriobacteriales bacterium]|jgi:glutamine amidotransferase|nr:imidazole glycerol phosphate synthase subunit HisH [Coriobacteriales bacterium]